MQQEQYYSNENERKSKDENLKRLKLSRIEESRKCSICNHEYISDYKNSLYCDECREHSERYKFAEWLLYG